MQSIWVGWKHTALGVPLTQLQYCSQDPSSWNHLASLLSLGPFGGLLILVKHTDTKHTHNNVVAVLNHVTINWNAQKYLSQ